MTEGFDPLLQWKQDSGKGRKLGYGDGLKLDPEDYDNKVRLLGSKSEYDPQLGGMTNHPAFYEACDKYGIMIWMISLANPVDGPIPVPKCSQAADNKKNRSMPPLSLLGRTKDPPQSLTRVSGN